MRFVRPADGINPIEVELNSVRPSGKCALHKDATSQTTFYVAERLVQCRVVDETATFPALVLHVHGGDTALETNIDILLHDWSFFPDHLGFSKRYRQGKSQNNKTTECVFHHGWILFQQRAKIGSFLLKNALFLQKVISK